MHVIVACTFLVLMRIDSSMARNASSNNTSLLPLLDDSSYNIIHQLEKKADDVPWDASPSKT
jgi:hypothetical protein